MFSLKLDPNTNEFVHNINFPMVIVEVKSHNGDSWRVLMSQQRDQGFALRNRNSNAVYMIAVRGLKISFARFTTNGPRDPNEIYYNFTPINPWGLSR